jgi:N-succinyldiaminopimelate aminotransferase
LNPYLPQLKPYPFERLAALNQGVVPPDNKEPIVMSIGEPRYPTPQFIRDELVGQLGGLSHYPATQSMPELRTAIAQWLTQRFSLKPGSLKTEHNVLPVNGSREALFAFAQCIVDAKNEKDLVLMPNPFYQIYEGAALLAGVQPYFININQATLLPDFEAVPEAIWQRCQLLYACSPGNPTGAVFDLNIWRKLIELADKYDFVIASDECYSEIYLDEDKPPIGLLQACAQLNRHDYSRCIVFNSLSKRSSVPGLRSGLVAGDAKIIEKFLLYRTYHGSAMSPPTQAASLKAWSDEKHVIEARQAYRQNFDTFSQVLSPLIDLRLPDGAFYVWLPTPIDDQEFARELYRQQNLLVLPGSFISRFAHGQDPGKAHVRIALVGSTAETKEAASRIKNFAMSLDKKLSTHSQIS